MGYRACKSLYVAPAPLSAGGSSKMASKVRNRVRNVSQQVSHHARRRVWPWHSTRGKAEATQTPTATPEGGRLQDLLCTCRQSHVGAYTFLALERRLALLPTAEPPGVRRSVTADISVASSQERSSSASLHHCRRTSGAQARITAGPALR